MMQNHDDDDVIETSGKFTNKRGKEIFYRDWKPARSDGDNGALRAVVILSHGFAEHSGRLRHVGHQIAKQNILVTCHDHIGHGLSAGKRAHARTCDWYVNDVVQHAELKQEQHPNLPLFLLGHSMGSHVAVRTVMFHPDLFRGVIASAAPLTIDPNLITPVRYYLAKLAAALMPHYQVVKLRNDKTCRDENVIKEFNNDELCYRGGMKAGWCKAMYDSLLYIIANMEQVRTPILALHGTADLITEPRGSVDLINRAAATDKTLKMYDDAYHSLFMEPDVGPQATQDVIDWIEQRL